jgi:hypothetical protein
MSQIIFLTSRNQITACLKRARVLALRRLQSYNYPIRGTQIMTLYLIWVLPLLLLP